jgi:hypothetical protein
MPSRKPSRKYRRRERRAAARHGLPVEKYRGRNDPIPDGPRDPWAWRTDQDRTR